MQFSARRFPLKRWVMGDGSAATAGRSGSILDRLLDARGVEGGAAREAFLRPTLGHLQHPKAMHGMRSAAEAICAAVRAGRRIAIYGDYDVDGVMATAILWHMLRTVAPTLEVRTYVPHRIEEGYGLNADALRSLRAEGIEFIITVDCGVSAISEAKLAAELGLELVITDHHELKPSGEIPVAAAVVHPRLPGEQRFGELCGAGVAWKLAWMIGEVWCGSSRQPDVFRNRLVELAPLAAMGTIADVVPLIGENRVLVARGLTEIGRTRIPGIDALLAASRVTPGDVDTEKIMFRVAPRINASGRMGHAKDAIELFTTAGPARAEEIVDMLGELNDRRRKDERAIFDQALAQLRGLGVESKPRGIVLHDEQWNLGIVGIVCSKLVDLHACPVVLITRNGEGYKGSGRSVRGIELHRVLASCSDHLSGFGGHAMAAGVHLSDVAQIEAFRRRFTEECDRLLPPEDEQKPVLEIDCACRLDEISSTAAVTDLESLAPFGRDNRKPMFMIAGVEITQTRVFGKTSATVPAPPHLELVIKQRAGSRDAFLRVQWWGAAEHAASFPKGSRVDLVVEVGISTFSRLAEVEARLVDIREAIPARQEAIA